MDTLKISKDTADLYLKTSALIMKTLLPLNILLRLSVMFDFIIYNYGRVTVDIKTPPHTC